MSATKEIVGIFMELHWIYTFIHPFKCYSPKFRNFFTEIILVIVDVIHYSKLSVLKTTKIILWLLQFLCSGFWEWKGSCGQFQTKIFPVVPVRWWVMPSGEQARGRGSLSSWEVEGALQLSLLFSGLCMWSLLDSWWSTSQQGYQVLTAIVVLRDEVLISLSPLSGNFHSFTFTKFYWSSSYRTQIQEGGHQSHLMLGELSKNLETIF